MEGVENNYQFDISDHQFTPDFQFAASVNPSTTPEGFFAAQNSALYSTNEPNYTLSQYGFHQFKNPNQNLQQSFLGDHFSTQIQNMTPNGSYRRISPFSESNNQVIIKGLDDLEDSHKRSISSLPFDANHDFLLNQLGQPSNTTTTSSNYYNSSAKTRIRWSEDLHDRFVDCVNELGGPDKATPKAILKLMQQDNHNDGLTILHIKSHLQKYRNVKYVPESVEGISKKTCTNSVVAQIDNETGMQLKEALQLQIDVQKRLHEQLEIQNKLQLRIEEQGKKLKMMIEEQQLNLITDTKSTNSSSNFYTIPNNSSPTQQQPEVLVSEGFDDNCFSIQL